MYENALNYAVWICLINDYGRYGLETDNLIKVYEVFFNINIYFEVRNFWKLFKIVKFVGIYIA